MNSRSECNYNKEKSENEKKNDCDSKCYHSMPGEVLLKCKRGRLGPINSTLQAPSFSQTFNQQIARSSIDASCLKCPNVLISFDGILSLSSITNLDGEFLVPVPYTFTFTLFKICHESEFREQISTFNYSTVNLSNFGNEFQESNTLSFQYSACNDECNDCCSYILELTSIFSVIVDPGITTISTLFSINGELCALAVG